MNPNSKETPCKFGAVPKNRGTQDEITESQKTKNMKTIRTLLLASAALPGAALLPTLSACTPSPEAPRVPWTSPDGSQLPDKPVYIGADKIFCHVRKAPEENARLRRALAEAAVVQIEIESLSGGGSERQKYTLSRERTEGLAKTLDHLAAVPQWLELRMYTSADIDYARIEKLRLLNATGELLWTGNPHEVSYQPSAGAAPTSLHAALAPYLPSEK